MHDRPRLAIQRHMRRQGWGLEWWLAYVVCKPALVLLKRRDWRGHYQIPSSGGAVLAANHVSHLDPLLVAEMVLSQGRTPVFLAKHSLFERGVVGWWFRAAGHVAVDRENGKAGYETALAALRDGALLVVYPEGSIPTDPSSRLTNLKTGAVRLALESGAPLIPIAQRGAQEILPAYGRRLRVFRRPVVSLHVGPPLDMRDLTAAGEVGPQAFAAGTRRMATILRGMVAAIDQQ